MDVKKKSRNNSNFHIHSFGLIMYLVYGAEGVLTVDEAILKDGVPSRDLPEEPR